MKSLNFFSLFLLLMVSAQAHSTPEGWRWYNEPRPVEIKEKRAPAPTQNSTTTVTTMSATEQMEWFHAELKEAIADATINPLDEEKYLKVMRMKQFINDKTSQTGMTFKKLILEHPEFSYIKDRPIEQAARGTYYELERNKRTAALEKMKADGWAFFFVYNGEDVMTQKLAPSMQDFADTYNFELLGVSEDGVFIDAITNNRVNDGRVSVPFAPALILVNPNTKEMRPLAYGFISQTELLARFFNVANEYKVSDF